jgi:uncharacterized membrane protein
MSTAKRPLATMLRHLLIPDWLALRAFPRATLDAIEQAVRESEALHSAELRFVVEGGLDVARLARGVTARARATELFASLRVWDTDENSGVLIYLQMVDRRIEILADRGIAARVPQESWNAVCRGMEVSLRAGRHREAALHGVREITALLASHFPARARNPDELPDRPLLL